MKRMQRLTEKVQTILAAGVLAAAAAGAATTNVYIWTGGAAGDSSNWFNPTNWSGPSGYGVPGDTHNPAGLQLDGAFFQSASNVAGTVNYSYVPGVTPHTNVFSFLNLAKTDTSSALTFNFDGDMIVEHNNVADPDWWQSISSIGGGGKLTANIRSGTLAVKTGKVLVDVNATSGSLNVASNAALVAFAFGTSSANRQLAINGVANIDGWCGTRGATYDNVAIGSMYVSVSGTMRINSGGTVYGDGFTSGGNSSTLTITNGATLLTRYGGSGIGQTASYGTGYNHLFRMYGGVVTNRGALTIGGINVWSATAPGTGRLLIDGGDWFQGGMTRIGFSRVGVVAVSGGTLACLSDVCVGGGGGTASYPIPSGIASLGTLTVTGGTVVVSNPDSGVLYTTTQAGRHNPSMITHYFGVPAGTWDHTYSGQRLIVDSLAGSGSGLESNVVYYAGEGNLSVLDSKSTFAFYVTADAAAGVTGSASYAAGSTYHTLPARLMVGNSMTFSGASALMITGILNLVSGSLTADELIATNGAASVLNFLGGSLTVKNATDISNGVETVFGNGVSSALLELVAGTHRFADGLVITNNATLAAGGTNAVGSVSVTGDLAFAPGAALDVDFDAATNDWLEVSGAVALADEMTLVLRMSGDTARSPVTVLKASEGITGSVVAWPAVTVNSVKYRAVVAGDQLRLEKIARGTLVGIL